MIKDKLQIVIITYNRSQYLERTLNEFFAEASPVKEYDIVVLNNNSTDDTINILEKYEKRYSNLSHITNNYNVGANANIVKAFELNSKDYVWVVADDDCYDWENWAELERAIDEKENAIIISRMDLPEQYKNSNAKILHQASFISAVVFSKKLFNDTVFRNLYDNIYTMFPHLIPLVNLLNNYGKFYVLDKSIVKHGTYEDMQADDIYDEDWCVRGAVLSDVYRKSKTMSFEVGFAIALSGLKDSKLKNEAIRLQMETQVWRKKIYKQKNVIYKILRNRYYSKEDITQLLDLYLNVDDRNGKIIKRFIKKMLFPTIIDKFFLFNSSWCFLVL